MDSDDIAVIIDYGAAATAGLGYGAGLQHSHAAAGVLGVPAAFGYSSGGDRGLRALQLPLGVSQGPYRSFRLGRVDKFQGIYSGRGSGDQQGEVVVGAVLEDTDLAESAVVGKAYPQFGSARDDVLVGYYVSLVGHEESAASALLGLDEADCCFDLLGSASGRHGVLPLWGWGVLGLGH